MENAPTRTATVPTDASEDPRIFLAELGEIQAAAERIAAWQQAMLAELRAMRAVIEHRGR